MQGRSRKPMTSGVGVAYAVKGCNECTNPTKYSIGFWDGENGTHGQLFECKNLDCELKQNRLKATDYSEENKRKVKEINESNGIFVELIKSRRKSLGIIIRKVADGLGVSCSDYSNYEMCREALPTEMVGRIEEVFDKHMNSNSDQSIIWKVRVRNEATTWTKDK